jgi:CHAT domain-containing protein
VASDPTSLAGAVREAVWSVDPDQPVSEVVTMDGVLDREVGQRRVQAVLLGGLAALAMANEKHPDRAALILLSDSQSGDDGILEASEIVHLQTNADLVVLSACDTAVGSLQGEEGIANLSLAFMLAGAKNVVSTLWS